MDKRSFVSAATGNDKVRMVVHVPRDARTEVTLVAAPRRQTLPLIRELEQSERLPWNKIPSPTTEA